MSEPPKEGYQQEAKYTFVLRKVRYVGYVYFARYSSSVWLKGLSHGILKITVKLEET